MRIFLIITLFFTALLADRDGGPYLGIGYGTAEYSNSDYYDSIAESSSKAMSLYAGAYINKHLSVEVGYAEFGSSDKGFSVEKSSSLSNLSFTAFTFSVLGHYAFFNDVLDTYVRLGAGEIREDELSLKGFSEEYGVGIGVRFNKWLSMKVAYDMYRFKYEEPVSAVKYGMSIDYMYAALEVQF
ncbi:outer membrane beta-barrel protein [Candidatus Sulfurimonas baltica]|uniref:Outer membrane beta-barrel protein n=1 Tax=Candidatus Sulfurimonas baltica TaxID=2740404 RepID=A0A7S7LWU1_9BACT|nr:outer membrane beta-barrel protein [Candidatus Sulfurimonas baltica]QOY52850.1 outer membrane beta-barrel protein [Candidatus Sulfurimonas baltica]